MAEKYRRKKAVYSVNIIGDLQKCSFISVGAEGENTLKSE